MSEITQNKLQQFGVSPLLHYLDIETTDTQVTAVIASIGIASVNVITGALVGKFFQSVDVATQEGRTSSQGTIDFWTDRTKTSQQAYDLTFAGESSLFNALGSVTAYLLNMEAENGGGKVQVIGNGPEFDNSIVDHAFQQLGLRAPWGYQGNQSARTLIWLGRASGLDIKYSDEFKGVKHHALDDALWEAHCGQTILNSVAPALFGTPSILI